MNRTRDFFKSLRPQNDLSLLAGQPDFLDSASGSIATSGSSAGSATRSPSAPSFSGMTTAGSTRACSASNSEIGPRSSSTSFAGRLTAAIG